jgi:hypothetical protein
MLARKSAAHCGDAGRCHRSRARHAPPGEKHNQELIAMLSTDTHSTQTKVRGTRAKSVTFDLRHAVEVAGGDGIVVEVVTITPNIAAQWLKANRLNRPVRRSVWENYSRQITEDKWRVNGQAIIIAENEDILDGQHRLLAIIDAGKEIKSLVVYGISAEAFATIDTGAVRTPADALYLHFHERPVVAVKAAATAAQWCSRLERGTVLAHRRMSNADIIDYVNDHQSLFQWVETLSGFPKDSRPLSLGIGCALYELFARKNLGLADQFMAAVYTGENLNRKDVEFVLRQALLKDAQRTTRLPVAAKVRMAVKAWNWRRRGMPEAAPNVVAIRTDEEQGIKIL